MQFLSLLPTLMLIFPLIVCGQTVTLRTYQTMDRTPARLMYAFNGKAQFAPASSVTRDALAGLVLAAARDMQSKISQLPAASYQPAAMSAFTDGSGTVWFHSSIKGAPANTNALRTAQILTQAVQNALQWCEDRGGHGNDGNCGEVGVVNMWMLDTGMTKAVKETSLIVTAYVPAPPAQPYIIPPCGTNDTKGCKDFLRGVGLGNQMCQINSKRSVDPPVVFARIARRGSTARGAVRRSATGGKVLGKRQNGTKKTAADKKAAGGAAGGAAATKSGAKKLVPVEKIPVTRKKLPTLAKVAAKFLEHIWSLGCAGKPKAAAGAAKDKKNPAAAKDKKAAPAAAAKDKKAAPAAAAGATKCKAPKKLVNGVCK